MAPPRQGRPHPGKTPSMLIQAESLSGTVDAVSEAFVNGTKISPGERKAVASWIASRQGLPGAYADTFAGFETERTRGIQLFSGERVTSASARHILGEEACRVLRQLDSPDFGVKQALKRATQGLLQCLERAATGPRKMSIGIYCCGKCTVGLWRHLIVGGLDRQEDRLQDGIQSLRSKRDEQGGWQTFPFWYTILALSEIDIPAAADEIHYACALLKRTVARSSSTRFAKRRQMIARRALAKI